MGYTHYWTGLEADGLEEHARKIIDTAMESGIKLGDGWGENEPIVSKGLIIFNGCGADSHETFALSDDVDFNFCKTAQKPYDDVVVAILIDAIVRDDITYDDISSDGYIEEWQDGIALYEKSIGKLTDDDIQKLKDVIGTYAE